MSCIEETNIQAQIAENIGTSPSYVNKIIRSKEQIVNKTFLAMMEDIPCRDAGSGCGKGAIWEKTF